MRSHTDIETSRTTSPLGPVPRRRTSSVKQSDLRYWCLSGTLRSVGRPFPTRTKNRVPRARSSTDLGRSSRGAEFVVELCRRVGYDPVIVGQIHDFPYVHTVRPTEIHSRSSLYLENTPPQDTDPCRSGLTDTDTYGHTELEPNGHRNTTVTHTRTTVPSHITVQRHLSGYLTICFLHLKPRFPEERTERLGTFSLLERLEVHKVDTLSFFIMVETKDISHSYVTLLYTLLRNN